MPGVSRGIGAWGAIAASLVLGGCAALGLQGASGPPSTGDLLNNTAHTGSQPLTNSQALGAVLEGTVRGADGKAAAAVEVQAFEVGRVGTGGAGLVSNNAAGLVSNNAAGMAAGNSTGYRIQGAATRAVTDPNGRFALSVPATGAYNVEASDKASGFKAWQGGVVVDKAGSRVEAGGMELAPTGSIAGKVAVPDVPTISNFEGIDVFVPGSSYLAKCDRKGTFTLADLAPGTFDLVATRPGLGRGEAKGVRVRSRETTSLGDLVLQAHPPRITGFEPVVVAVGGEVTIAGADFGASEGVPFAVTVGGVDVLRARRMSDERIEFVVPKGVTGGEVQVEVGGVRSEIRQLTVFESLGNDLTLGDLTLVPSGIVSLRTFGMLGNLIAAPLIGYAWQSVGPDAAAITLATESATAVAPGRALALVAAGALSATQSVLVLPSQPVVETIAGDAYRGHQDGALREARFRDVYGLAAAPDGSIVVADSESHCIRRIDIASNSVTTVAGDPENSGFADGTGSEAQFYQPRGVAVAPDGTIYVADYFNYCIRKIQAGGVVSTFAGKGGVTGLKDGAGDQARFGGPISLSWMPDGALLVTDKLNSALRKVTMDGKVSTLAGNGVDGSRDGQLSYARLSRPRDAVAMADGTLWILDAGGRTLRRIQDGEVRTVASFAWRLEVPYVVERGLVKHRDLDTGVALVKGPNGSLFVADSEKNRLAVIWPDGMANSIAGGAQGETDGAGQEARFFYPYAMTALADGNLLIADSGSGTMRLIRMPEGFKASR